MKTVSAYQARVQFGELLNDVYYKGEEIIIERKGKPMAKILPLTKITRKTFDPFLAAAGIWKNLNTDKIIRTIINSRKDKSGKKKYLAKW